MSSVLRLSSSIKPPADGNAQKEVFRALVERVAASELFQKSPRLREFLLYAAQHTLENHLSEVREQVIAERVFGRGPAFQGTQDSIVRAEARNLRRRLEVYFETDGKDEPILITMPKGGYSLAFEPRTASVDHPVVHTQGIPGPVLPAPDTILPNIPPRKSALRPFVLVLGAAAILSTALAIYWYSANAQLRGQLRITNVELPFSALFAGERDVLVVTSDTAFLQIATLAHRRITLNEYIERSYPDTGRTQPPDLVKNWNIYEFTDGREMAIAGLLVRSNAQYTQRIELRSGHAVQLQDFKEHSSILIGSPISNPWAELYEDKLNFHCTLTEPGTIIFYDGTLGSRASHQYPNADDEAHRRTYARLVFLPKVSDAAATLLIAGTTAQATQTAGELVADHARMSALLRSIGVDPKGSPRFFEILIRCNTFVGGAILPEVVASRLKPAS